MKIRTIADFADEYDATLWREELAGVIQPHIVDADGTLADITTKFNTLLAQLEALGLLETSQCTDANFVEKLTNSYRESYEQTLGIKNTGVPTDTELE